MQKIGKDIYVESSFPGVTVGAIVTPEGVVLIDAPTHPADAQLWRMRIRELTDKPVRYSRYTLFLLAPERYVFH